MYSDDSAASEIASDDEEHNAFGDESVASEIEESGGDRNNRPPAAKPQAAQPSSEASADDAYDDEVYENEDEGDDDGYSVDFEDDTPASPVALPKRLASPVRISASSPVKQRPKAISEDAEYYSDASFEDESRKFMSASQSTRLVVDLSIPKDSPTRRDSSVLKSPSSPYSNPNSPHVDLKVLSKPMVLAPASTATPTSAVDPLPPPSPQIAVPYPPGVVYMQPPQLLLADGDEKKFSLLLRKVESKFEDQIEELREKNTLLQWKERELKAELRAQRDELKMRKSRIEKKRKRALERRHDHERMVDKLKAEVSDMNDKIHVFQELTRKLEAEKEHLGSVISNVDAEKRTVHERNLALTEKLQSTLSDFHALNMRFEETVNAKLDAEKRINDMLAQHRVEIEVLQHKCRLDVESAQRALEAEIASRTTERLALPENYRLIVAAEKDRCEKLEAALTKQMRELETAMARDALKSEAEVARAVEQRKLAEDKADKRVQEELQTISRERDAIDEQRRELLLSVTRTNARLDEERGKLEALRAQLDVRQMKLVEERAELDARAAFLDDRVAKLNDEESTLERRKVEVTRLGRETFEKTRSLTQRMQNYSEIKSELEKLRAEHETLRARAQESEWKARAMEQEKATLDKTVLQLQQERLLVAKQRIQSRQFLDNARKLESMLQQQNALEQHGLKHCLWRLTSSAHWKR
uniref:Uncharacterized protein n=1 Tax=Globisporangium ultimum (strain ATCC 200006 / CBS 805.95 / DAOM BR144) TaxID=431595 RepID=K3XCB7_GLOUD